MKPLLFFLGIVLGIVGIQKPAEAQNYPWCIIYGTGFGGKNCGFVSFEQCLATVTGIGGFCMENNTYQPPPGSRPYTRVQRRYPY